MGLDAVGKEFFQNKNQFTAAWTVITVYGNVITITESLYVFMNRYNDYRNVIRFHEPL
jgi:hypothetical protein